MIKAAKNDDNRKECGSSLEAGMISIDEPIVNSVHKTIHQLLKKFQHCPLKLNKELKNIRGFSPKMLLPCSQTEITSSRPRYSDAYKRQALKI
jgi:hypothetical protein